MRSFFYPRDDQTNVIALLDNSGAVVVKYKYDAWGNCITTVVNSNASTIATLNPFRYRSYYFDTEIGFYFLKTRYYDPEIGRFMTIDEISYLDPENINGLNLYAYCRNNPMMYCDPSGNITLMTAAIIAAIIGAAVGAVAGATFAGATYLMFSSDVTWRGLFGEMADGAITGWCTGGLAGYYSIVGAGLATVFWAFTITGLVSGFVGSFAKHVIKKEKFTEKETWKSIIFDTIWNTAWGSIGGLVQGATKPASVLAKKYGIPLGRYLTKHLKRTIKNIVPALFEELLSNFTSWFARKKLEYFFGVSAQTWGAT